MHTPTAPDTGPAPLPVLALATLWPSRWSPRRGLFNYQLYRALAGRGRLEVVAPVPWTLLGRRPEGRPPPDPCPVRRPVFWYPPRSGRGLHGWWLLASAWRALRAAARAARPRALLSSWLFPEGWAGVGAGRRLGLPVVVQVLGSDANQWAQEPANRRRLREILDGAALLAPKSRALAAELVRLGAPERKVAVLPNGVDSRRFRPRPAGPARRRLGLEDRRRWLVFVGNLVPEKDPTAALEALALLPPEVGLLVVGEGPLRPVLEARARRPELAGRVRLAGPVDHGLVPDCLAAAEALVLPSRREGDPNVVLEALAAGRPVAASRVGGVPGLVAEGEQGFLAPPGDPAGLARAVERVLARSWRPEELAASVAHRTWEASARRLEELLRRAVEIGP